MGLDSFKTEGPRTYKKGTTFSSDVSTDSIHIMNGMDNVGHGFLKRHEVHVAFKTKEAMEISLPEGSPYYICSECGKISPSYEAMLKTDLIDFLDYDWVDTARVELLKEFEGIDETVYHKDGLEGVELADDSTDEDSDDDSSSSSSSSSSSKDEDFNSGLGSFTS